MIARDFWPPDFFSWIDPIWKSRAAVPLKTLKSKKTPGGKKHIISSYSKAKNMPKIAEVKLLSCRLDVAGFRKNWDCRVAVAEQHFFKSCGIAIAEVLPSSCGIAIADSKKGAHAHLCWPDHHDQCSGVFFGYEFQFDMDLFLLYTVSWSRFTPDR